MNKLIKTEDFAQNTTLKLRTVLEPESMIIRMMAEYPRITKKTCNCIKLQRSIIDRYLKNQNKISSHKGRKNPDDLLTTALKSNPERTIERNVRDVH